MADLKTIGDIQVFAEIHQGAISTVYKGFQKAHNRVVLLKVLRPEFSQNGKLFQNFWEEAKIIAKIRHPNVVAIYEQGSVKQWHYFATEFVEGLTLKGLIEIGKLSAALSWFILYEVANGLKAAHDKNIFHKDIKPSNILISNSGIVKLADFGMADLWASSSNGPSEIKGTLGYFSPEQILGEAQGKFSDIFALGATFYEMLSGTPAFYGTNTNEYFNSILQDDPILFLSKNSELPPDLIEICRKMLEKGTIDRYQSCDHLLADLTVFRKKHKLKIGSQELASYIEDPQAFAPKVFPIKSADASRLSPGAYPWLFLILILILSVLGYATIFQSKKPHGSNHRNLGDSSPLDELDTENTSQVDVTESSMQVPAPPGAEILEKDNSAVAGFKVGANNKDESRSLDSLISPNESINSTGYLSLRCRPWAYVFVDGDSLGMTPFSDSLELKIGSHNLVLKNPLFPEYRAEVEIVSGISQHYEFSLWTMVGLLTLEVNPWAEVHIDGKYLDTVPPQTRPFILTPGEHVLELKHPALGNFNTSFEIEAEQELNLKFNLNTLLSH